jgi:hypothetical protein
MFPKLLSNILASQSLLVANRVAPVVSCGILTGFAFMGKRLTVVEGDQINLNQQEAVITHNQYKIEERSQSWFAYWFGG